MATPIGLSNYKSMAKSKDMKLKIQKSKDGNK